MLLLDLVVLDHVVGLLDRSNVFDAVLVRFRMQIVEPAVLGCLLYMPEAFRLDVLILRLVYYYETGAFHFDYVLPGELPVMADLLDLETGPPHLDEPVHYIRNVDRR